MAFRVGRVGLEVPTPASSDLVVSSTACCPSEVSGLVGRFVGHLEGLALPVVVERLVGAVRAAAVPSTVDRVAVDLDLPHQLAFRLD